ncbi:MAG: hypothetical protein QGH45_23590 [Myxococcota bacterium]|nr:hypothetical protein [Myxococcota bacterium]
MGRSAPPRPRTRRRWFRGALLAAVLVPLLAVGVELTPLVPAPRAPTDVAAWPVEGEITLESALPGVTLQYVRAGFLWASRQADVFRSDDLGRSWARVGRLCPAEPGPADLLRHLAGRSHLARALRPAGGIETLLVLRSGTVLAAAGARIYRQVEGEGPFAVVHRQRTDPEWKKIFRQWGEDGSGDVWFGEYGVERLADSRILVSRDDGLTFEVAHTFPRAGEPGGIRHVHGVQVDPFTDRVWVVTGDRPDESRIGWLDGDGGFRAVGEGSRQWTAVSLMFTPDAVLWGTDALREPCGIFRWDRESRETTRVAELDGPVFHSAVLADGRLLVATEIEGVGSDGVSLWLGEDPGRWERVLAAPPYRDAERAKLGTFSFPLGDPLPVPMFTADRIGEVERAAYLASWPGR